MDNLFLKVINNENSMNDDINDYNIIESTHDEIFTEATYAEQIPYMKVFPRVFNLPKGSPVGKGNLCFLFSQDFDDIKNYLFSSKNAISGNRFYYYYLTPIYKGKIYNKRYNKKIMDERKEIYSVINEHPYLHAYRKLYINQNESLNMFFDMHMYLKIFNDNMKKVPPMKKISTYWTYIKSILNNYNNLSKYNYKFILVNLDEYKIEKKIVNCLDNPLIIVYYTLFKYPELLQDFDYDFFFYTSNKVLRFNPAKSKIDKQFYKLFKVQMNRIITSINIDKLLDEREMIKNDATENALSDIMKNVTVIEPRGKDVNDKNNIDKRVRAKVERIREEIDDLPEADPSDLEDFIKTKAENEINSDDELIKDIYTETNNKIMPTKPTLSARDELLKKSQKDIILNGMTINDIQKIESTHMPIPEKDISGSITSPNKNISKVTFQNFEKVYNEKVMPKDITNAILSLNDKSIPMFVRDIKIEDTSDELNYKDTYTIYLEDVNRQRHTVKVDIPKFLEDKFIYIGGNKKLIKKQNFFYPVVKISEGTVQIVTNYNKMTIQRIDTKSVSSVERLKKLINTSDSFKKYFIFGNANTGNKNVITSIEYDELSKFIVKFKSKNGNCVIFFSQDEAQKYIVDNKIKVPNEKSLFIGIENDIPIFIDIETQKSDSRTIIDIILSHCDDELYNQFSNINIPKRLMYTKVRVMNQDITVMNLLCFWEGFSRVLNRMNLKYELFDKKPKILASNQSMIRFADCWMVYDDDNVSNSILLNGIRVIDTEKYNIADMDTMNPYMNYFMKIYGKSTIANALTNFYEFTIDPITKEILIDINLPTDIVELMIYAVSLLADSQYTPETNQKLSRVRSNEIVPAILYEALAKNYVNYKNSNGTKKYSIPQDIVIKNLLALKTVEDYSTLNPVLEMEMTHSISSKGFRGVNLERSYTPEKRVYDQSMIGIIAPSSSPDGNVGVLKTLSCEPNITSVRGYVNIKNDHVDELKDVNLFSPGEMSIPLAGIYDDPTRLGHAIKQSKHVIPVKDSSPVLISNGMEEIARFKLSSDFVVNADESGEVVEIDEDTNIMVVKYKSGKHKAVNLSEFIVKNGGGGFFLSNKLITNLKVGDKFKADDVLAYHKDFFTNDKFNNARMNMGTLAKVAIMSTYNTYQDATVISQRLADAAATEMCFMTQAVIGKNSNITFMINNGDEINVGEPLIQFDTSYDDNELNILLANIGDDDTKKQITEESKNTIKSKYSGVIESIEIYSTVPLDELSPSLKKIVSKYYKKYDKRKTILEKYDPDSKKSVVKCGILCKEPTHEIDANKYGVIKGQNVLDSVLINFYIKHSEPLEIGSKIANFTALKNTIGEIIPENYEPYSEYHPDEIVDTLIASNSILKRMTPSILLTSLGNKCIIELKNKLREIYEK